MKNVIMSGVRRHGSNVNMVKVGLDLTITAGQDLIMGPHSCHVPNIKGEPVKRSY